MKILESIGHYEPIIIKYTKEAWEKIQIYTEICPVEVSGFGIVEWVDNIALVKDTFILKQKNSMAETDIDSDAIFNAMMEASAKGTDTSDWGLWWHSHVNFKCNPSETDYNTIELLSAKKPLITLIINKAHEVYSRVDIYEPLRVAIEEVSIEIMDPARDAMLKQCYKDYKKKVKILKG